MSVTTVYTKPGCMPCRATERRLGQHGLTFALVDVSQNPAALDALVAEGYRETPVVKTADGHAWSGYRPDRIDALARREA